MGFEDKAKKSVLDTVKKGTGLHQGNTYAWAGKMALEQCFKLTGGVRVVAVYSRAEQTAKI